MGTPNLFATAACCLLIVLAPHALGGATATGSWFIAAGSCVVLGAVLANARELERRRFLIPAGWAALSLQLFTMLQALPLPCTLVRYLSPGSFTNTMHARMLLGGDVVPCSLSYDVGATQASLAWTVTLLCSLFAFAMLVQLGGRWVLLVSVATSSALVALAGLLHKVGGVDALYGLYQPIYVHPRVLGPLINENHLGAYIALGVPLMIALGLETDEKGRGAFWFIAASVAAGTAILTLSRGAFAMLALELVLLICFVASSRGKRRHTDSRLLLAIVPAAGGLALGLFAVGEELLGEFYTGDAHKLRTIWAALKFSAGAPLIGVGRGAFAAAFTRVFGSTGRSEYAESLVVQWAADWGWPLAVVVLLWAGWWIARSLAKASQQSGEHYDTVQAASLIALVALAFQNLVDFNIDLPGVIPAVAALFVAAVIPTRDQIRERFAGDAVLAKPLSVQVCAAALVPSLLGFFWCVWNGSSDVAFEELQRQVQSRSPSRDMLASLKGSIARHPSDARFALLGASVATAAQDSDAAGWVAYARELAPGWAGPRLLDAYQKLLNGDAEAAALEVRSAVERDPASDGGLTCPIAITLATFKSDVTQLIPEGSAAVPASDRLSACEHISPEIKRQVDILVSNRIPGAASPRVRLAQNRARPAAERIRLLAPLVSAGTNVATVYGLLADAYDDAGKPELADQCLKKGITVSDQPYLIYDFIAYRHGKAGRMAQMREAIRSMRAAGADRATTLADSYAREGAIEASFGDRRLALEAFEKAYRQVPRREWLEQLLSTATGLGDSVKVKWARIALCREGDSASCSAPELVHGTAFQAHGYVLGERP